MAAFIKLLWMCLLVCHPSNLEGIRIVEWGAAANSKANGSGVAQRGGHSEDHNVPVLPIYNLATSLRYAVATVEEMRFRSSDFGERLVASASVGKDHLRNLEESQDDTSKDSKKMRTDSWMALQALDALLQRVTTACDRELRGTWLERGWTYVSNLLRQAPEQGADDVDLSTAVDILQRRAKQLKDALADYTSQHLCPRLSAELVSEVRIADSFAQKFARVFGESLYLLVAEDTPYYAATADYDVHMSYATDYSDVLDQACFWSATLDSVDSWNTDADLNEEEEMRQTFNNQMRRSTLILAEMLHSCPFEVAEALPKEVHKAIYCYSATRDAMLSAELHDMFGRATGQVKQWLKISEMFVNAAFDSTSLAAVLNAAELSTSWLSSLMWLAYRTSTKVSIRDECIEAAGNLTLTSTTTSPTTIETPQNDEVRGGKQSEDSVNEPGSAKHSDTFVGTTSGNGNQQDEASTEKSEDVKLVEASTEIGEQGPSTPGSEKTVDAPMKATSNQIEEAKTSVEMPESK
mmetsp:Transcript_410/g.935  ORF Transcript_410/g.935 Transcript_410/m.935 type:complete len:521 (+) Transcript_410:130-1692(+)|eukprot:CAMPEP_0206501322 /NCGR_PEP_ID=MMETSP0324_2-20121206/53235_1 /ASSEMBLY_ACC=CAM_ASM_000836 /TAXON_ID=2866 /ORGANISM="Crypthecodinium cohnii, Strain Seligo" /LENGTH=520 /DNA_ID=CAMNT_0053989107 /DNA_START=19 /DNA_END=1581 /DNA_ORIENTATION=+